MTDKKRKANWRKACEITLSNGLDFELVEEDQEHVQFLIEQGMNLSATSINGLNIYESCHRSDAVKVPLIVQTTEHSFVTKRDCLGLI